MKITFRSPHRVTLIPLAVIGLSLAAVAEEGWLVDVAIAKAQSAKEGKPILMEFSGSEWCPSLQGAPQKRADIRHLQAADTQEVCPA